MITFAQLCWVAGVLEGEGCFRRKTTGQRYATVEVNMGDEDVVRRLAEYTGVGRVYGPYASKRNPAWTPMWRWQVQREADAVALAMTVWPLMCERRRGQIADVLRWWRSK